MNVQKALGVTVIFSLFSLAMLGIGGFSQPIKAARLALHPSNQGPENSFQAIGVSGLAFVPVQQNATYIKDTQRQILTLLGQDRNYSPGRNLFVAPLMLPDRVQLVTFALFGEDFDNQGEVRVRLKRCDQIQARCMVLAEGTSAPNYAGGAFDTGRITIQNEVVNNSLYTYFLELELTALLNSGLRAVRLETVAGGNGSVPPPPDPVEQWSLSGSVRSFALPNAGIVQAKICSDDLSHLSNPTHYPFVVADGRIISLGSNMCVTVWGQDINIERRPNTGPSSGTYQFIR